MLHELSAAKKSKHFSDSMDRMSNFQKATLVAINDNDSDNLKNIRKYAKKLKFKEYQVFQDPNKAWRFMQKHKDTIDLLIVDYYMGSIKGSKLIKKFFKLNNTVPSIIITSNKPYEELKKIEKDSLKHGATDFMTSNFTFEEFKIRTRNLLNLRFEIKDELEGMLLKILSMILENYDKKTGEHSVRVAYYAKLLAKCMGKDKVKCNLILQATLMHDIGKLIIPKKLLQKSSVFTKKDFYKIKKHSIGGKKILDHKIKNSIILNMAVDLAYSHHERYDGTGYPNGLKGEEISEFSRIVAVADSFDAMTTRYFRVKQKEGEKSFYDSLDDLKQESGKRYDENIVQTMLDNQEKFKKMHDKFQKLIRINRANSAKDYLNT